MKKSIRQAVSRGVALLVLLPAAHTAFAGVAGSVEYRVAWDNTDSRYHVYMRPTTTPTPDLSMTGQVTLRVPHATDADKFTVTDIRPKSGTSWSLSSEVFGPTEDKVTDYLSFSFTPIDVRAFAFKTGVEQEAFSFKNTGPCMGSVVLMNNNTDPFNQPPNAPENSVGTNPGNQFANAGWGATDDNDYSGNYGTAADCGAIVTPTNHAPVAANDAASTTADNAVTISVLANDSDADGDNLSIASFTQGSKGTITQSGDALIYTPKAGASGSDTFTYSVTDPAGSKTTGTVTVTITAVTPPVLDATADAFTVDASNPSSLLDVLANDTIPVGETVTVEVIESPLYGTTSIQNNKIIYTPIAGYSGTDTLKYRITDGKGNTKEASITLTIAIVTPTNHAPVAANDAASTTADNAVTIRVLDNDSDADGDKLSIASFTQGSKGTITQSGDALIYTPKAGASGSDTFTYSVTDPAGSKTTGTVTVTITAVTPPVLDATADAFTVDANNPSGLLDVLANDTIPVGETVTVEVIESPLHGTTSIQNNKIIYTPTAGYSGTDTLKYRITDGKGNTKEASITLTIQAAPPVKSVAVPTLTQWAQLLLSLLLGVVALRKYVRFGN